MLKVFASKSLLQTLHAAQGLSLKGNSMFYRPVQTDDRHFSREIVYTAIDWTKLTSIVPAFRARIEEWYIVPANTLAADWHNAFSVAALDCLLIDTLAQFEKGIPQSDRETFIDYVKRTLPQFAATLPSNIRRNGRADITTPAEALYFGFRCAILHEAHIPPYCQILGESNIVRAESTGKTKYADGTDCCAVVLDPMFLLKALETNFNQYIENLLNSTTQHDQLRANFKKKFKASFGIDIDSAA